jgi:hypothetical protein
VRLGSFLFNAGRRAIGFSAVLSAAGSFLQVSLMSKSHIATTQRDKEIVDPDNLMYRDLNRIPKGCGARTIELYPLVVAGDKVATNALIENLLAFVQYKVAETIRHKPWLTDERAEMIEFVNYRVVLFVNRLRPGVEMPSLYCCGAVEKEIAKYQQLRARNRRQKQLYFAENSGEEDFESDGGYGHVPDPSREPDHDVVEEVIAGCETDRERAIVALLIDDPELTHDQIAEEIGCARTTVTRTIKRIRKRLEERDNLSR